MEEFTLEFSKKNLLYKAYMSFMKEGGLFVATNDEYEIGQTVTLKVLLPEEQQYTFIAGKVVWINSTASHNNTPPGIGVAFVDDQHNLKQRIETQLGTLLGSTEPTHTL
ncbi:PilZ domain-containing protein [Catenovulum sp. 2E275]|uniref:PilZ domain-containing protein n=1 Tax=Catenovulum sp. 2E275 TaxID=2980497 RepID=UPI0021D2CCB2|nr:PilZ domain-containing protein [Catenovulum sp. 2E275]MCU4674771.1 PilZ domain-containing protein [Catenovulum sp. 2E275]